MVPKRSPPIPRASRPDWAEMPIGQIPPWVDQSEAIIRDLEMRKNLIGQVRLLAQMATIENLPLTAVALSDTASRLHRILIELHEGYAMTHADVLDREMRRYLEETENIRLLLESRNKSQQKRDEKLKKRKKTLLKLQVGLDLISPNR